MNRKLLIAGFIGAIFPMLSGVALAAPLAILTDVGGSVQVVHEGAVRAGTNGMQLQAGDVVRVRQGGATLYYMTHAPQHLGGGQQVKVGALGAAAAPSVWRDVYTGVAQGFARRYDNTPATTRPGKAEAIMPVNTLVFEARPAFGWTFSGGVDAKIFKDHELTVKDAKGALTWRGDVTEMCAVYPADAPGLQAGQRYFWSVTPRQASDLGDMELENEQASNPVWFEIADAATTAAAETATARLTADLKSEPAATRNLAIAANLAQRGFTGAAIAMLTPDVSTEAIKGNEFQKAMHTQLGKLDETSRVLLRSFYLQSGQQGMLDKMADIK